ncbi:unnamed protein product [Amoebophrya sp. A25]|nr:unnamed protein product [Amoebophrya sp. A25]|eukprot:GSA25T00005049001.1
MAAHQQPGKEAYQDIYQEVLEYAKELFQVISQSGGPFSPTDNVCTTDIHNLAHSVTGMLLHMNWTEIAGEMLPDRSNTIKGKILEALGVFLKMKMKTLDDFIPTVCQEAIQMKAQYLMNSYHRRLTEALTLRQQQLQAANEATGSASSTGERGAGVGDSPSTGGASAVSNATSSSTSAAATAEGTLPDAAKEVISQFLFSFWLDVQTPQTGQPVGGEMHTIGSILVGGIVQGFPDPTEEESTQPEAAQRRLQILVQQSLSSPQEVLALMSCRLNDLTAQLIRLSMELYHRTQYMSIETSRPKMQSFFQYYTIDTKQSEMSTSLLSSHTSQDDPEYRNSVFSVQLIDSYSALLELLKKIDATDERLIAVDFEGVKLNRDGPLCLIQMTLSRDHSVVYVIDVFILAGAAISQVKTSRNTTLQSILESEEIEKVWFDPRNDADALFHQFGVYPKNVFDLQLAEVAVRRSQGLNVSYVQGLNKVLLQCSALDATQKKFSENIGQLGKNLFEPACGGDYSIFQKRPLDTNILVYSAHDARYMLELRHHLLENIRDRDSWIPRIFTAGQERVNWCNMISYFIPNSEAPVF